MIAWNPGRDSGRLGGGAHMTSRKPSSTSAACTRRDTGRVPDAQYRGGWFVENLDFFPDQASGVSFLGWEGVGGWEGGGLRELALCTWSLPKDPLKMGPLYPKLFWGNDQPFFKGP